LINLYLAVNDLGYGIHGRGLLQGLYQYNKDYNITPIGGKIQGALQENEVPIIQNGVANQEKWDRNSPSIYIFHEFMANQFTGTPMIAFPVFETDRFGKVAENYLRQMDHILVTSKWGKDVIEENKIEVPCTVIPEGVDPNIFYPEPMTQNKEFTFCTVGKWEVRKSTQEMLVAFAEEFEGSSERVTFHAHVINPFMGAQFMNQAADFMAKLGFTKVDAKEKEMVLTGERGNLRIEIPLSRVPDRKMIAKIYRSAHCGVFPSKAEGWGLPQLECLSCGTPIIVTKCTGQTEYLENYDERLMLIDLNKEIAADGVWFDGTRGSWYSISMDELKAKMRWAFENRDQLRSIGTGMSQYVRNNFSWNNAGKKLNDFLESLKSQNATSN